MGKRVVWRMTDEDESCLDPRAQTLFGHEGEIGPRSFELFSLFLIAKFAASSNLDSCLIDLG